MSDGRWSVFGWGVGRGGWVLAVLGSVALGGCDVPECGAGTGLSGGACLPLETDSGSDSDLEPPDELEPEWDTIFEETFEAGMGNWDLTSGNGLFRCGVEAVGDSNRYVQTVEFPQPETIAYLCWMDLVRRLDLSGYDEVRFTADYSVRQYDAGGAQGLAVLNLEVEQDDATITERQTWSNIAPADNGPQHGVMVVDLSPMGWADQARITLRLDMQSCPNPADIFCGATGDGLGHRIWMDNLRFEGR